MPDLPVHPYESLACGRMARHRHEYKPRHGSVQRCGCGSRTWQISAGGPLPILVTCRRCFMKNRVATEYEQGRYDALVS